MRNYCSVIHFVTFVSYKNSDCHSVVPRKCLIVNDEILLLINVPTKENFLSRKLKNYVSKYLDDHGRSTFVSNVHKSIAFQNYISLSLKSAPEYCSLCNVQQSENESYKISMKIRKVRFKMADPAGTKNRRRCRKTHKITPTQPQREQPALEVSPKSPSEDVPATSRTRKMAQKMKKLRSLHILHVPPSRSKTS